MSFLPHLFQKTVSLPGNELNKLCTMFDHSRRTLALIADLKAGFLYAATARFINPGSLKSSKAHSRHSLFTNLSIPVPTPEGRYQTDHMDCTPSESILAQIEEKSLVAEDTNTLNLITNNLVLFKSIGNLQEAKQPSETPSASPGHETLLHPYSTADSTTQISYDYVDYLDDKYNEHIALVDNTLSEDVAGTPNKKAFSGDTGLYQKLSVPERQWELVATGDKVIKIKGFSASGKYQNSL
ncbi:hypothetical protein JOM56_014237 [Amanita muscaria]